MNNSGSGYWKLVFISLKWVFFLEIFDWKLRLNCNRGNIILGVFSNIIVFGCVKSGLL